MCVNDCVKITYFSIRRAFVRQSSSPTLEYHIPRRNCYNLSVPAPGFRSHGFGLLWDVGGAGYVWSSAIADINVRYLGFGYGGIGPQNSNSRGYGFQLRCLQEQECR